MKLRPRESVIFAEDFPAMVAWYQNVLGFKLTRLEEELYHFANLSSETGIEIGIASAKEMGVTPQTRQNNSVVLQFEVADVAAFFEHVTDNGGAISFGPSFDKIHNFWFGGFTDLEGNPFWIVDENCP